MFMDIQKKIKENKIRRPINNYGLSKKKLKTLSLKIAKILVIRLV